MSEQPERLGKYTITSVLGRGAMGVVYKAFDPDIKRAIAIKTVSREFAGTDSQASMYAHRFRTEAEAAGRLTHPGIVNIYEYGEDKQVTYIAMEYVEGTSLREYFMRKVVFSEQDVVSLMSQLLDALGHAHAHGVWHRDIKPANLLIASKGQLKIADFGISRHQHSELTQFGLVMGTPGFMPPERYTGLQTDHRGDLFAAGVVLYQLVSNEMPFTGDTQIEQYQLKKLDLTPPSQREGSRGWRHYDTVAQVALEREPERRYQTAAEFRDALLSAYARPVASGIAPETVIRPTPPASFGQELPNSRGSAGAGPASTARPTGWDDAVLAEVEKQLTHYIGPVAKVIVRRTARQSADLYQLLETLAVQLSNTADRDAFMNATLRLGTGGPRPAPITDRKSRPAGSQPQRTVANRAGLVPLSPEFIERATRLLTVQLGPIARVLAKRAAQESTVAMQFAERLAAHIDQSDAREKFLRDLGMS